MLSQTQAQIMSKATQVILQSRVSVKKALFTHFQEQLNKFRDSKNKPSNMTIPQFLSELIKTEYYSIKQKFKQQSFKYNTIIKIQIIFILVERSTGRKIEAECWTIELLRKKDINNSSFDVITDFFKEIIFILNKLPLFSIYQKDKDLRAKYMQDYKILFQNHKSFSLIDLKAKDMLIRENQALRICAQISYLPSFKSLIDKEALIQEGKRKISIATSEYEGEKKVSVYAFYDPDLDFTFLSSDDEDFNKKGNSQSIEIQMDINQVELSEEFELLISNEDEQFLSQNKELLDELIKFDKDYLAL